MRFLLPLALLALISVPALAGDAPCCDGSAPVSGCPCENACPLAHEANLHRAIGLEALTVSPLLRKDVVAVLRRNLERI